MKTLLVIAYLSMFGEPSIKTYVRTDWNECRREASEFMKQIRAGSARAWCQRVAPKGQP
ncbi:MAG: hypothetical protein WC023_01705 [Rhodocyclaceae bacterium]